MHKIKQFRDFKIVMLGLGLVFASIELGGCGDISPNSDSLSGSTRFSAETSQTQKASSAEVGRVTQSLATVTAHTTYDPNSSNELELPCISIGIANSTYSSQNLFRRHGCFEGEVQNVIFNLQNVGATHGPLAKLGFKSATTVEVVVSYKSTEEAGLEKLKGKQVRIHGYISTTNNNQVYMYTPEAEKDIEIIT